MNVATINQQLLDAARRCTDAQAELERCVQSAANSERAYKRRQAIAVTQVGPQKNAGQRDAMVELLKFEDGATVGDLRYQAHLDENLRVSALEAVRTARTMLSAYQTLANLARAEAEFVRTGPQEAA